MSQKVRKLQFLAAQVTWKLLSTKESEGSGGGANKLFGLKINDTITIEFKEADNKIQNLIDDHDYSNS